MIKSFLCEAFSIKRKKNNFSTDGKIYFFASETENVFYLFFYNLNQIFLSNIEPWHVLYPALMVYGCSTFFKN